MKTKIIFALTIFAFLGQAHPSKAGDLTNDIGNPDPLFFPRPGRLVHWNDPSHASYWVPATGYFHWNGVLYGFTTFEKNEGPGLRSVSFDRYDLDKRVHLGTEVYSSEQDDVSIFKVDEAQAETVLFSPAFASLQVPKLAPPGFLTETRTRAFAAIERNEVPVKVEGWLLSGAEVSSVPLDCGTDSVFVADHKEDLTSIPGVMRFGAPIYVERGGDIFLVTTATKTTNGANFDCTTLVRERFAEAVSHLP